MALNLPFVFLGVAGAVLVAAADISSPDWWLSVSVFALVCWSVGK